MEPGKHVLKIRISNDNQSPVTKNRWNSYYYLYMYLYITLSTGDPMYLISVHNSVCNVECVESVGNYALLHACNSKRSVLADMYK